MQTMNHETTNVAALAIPGRIIEVVMDDTSGSVKMSESSGSTIVSSGKDLSHGQKILNKKTVRRGKRSPYLSTQNDLKTGKFQQSVARTLKKAKEAVNNAREATKMTVRKSDQSRKNLTNGSSGKKTQVYTSEVIIDQFALQVDDDDDDDTAVKGSKRISEHLHSKGANISGLVTKPAHNTRSARRLTKSSGRRFERILFQRPKGREESDILANTNFKNMVGDKAEHNNWMIDNEESSNSQNGLVIPTFHTKSRASSFNSFMQPKNGSKPVFRVGSSGDSDGVSNPCVQNFNSLSVEGTTSKHKGSSPSSKDGSDTCVICGNEPLTRGCALCKHCSNHVKQDGNRNGPLDELRAYAQSIANSVKKILLISPEPELSEGNVQNLDFKTNSAEDTKCAAPANEVITGSHPEVPLHRYMTEINLVNPQEARSKTLLNKSMSYDGRVSTCLDNKCRRSPLYLIGQTKGNAPDSFSMTADADCDCFTVEKEGKNFLNQNGDKNNRVGKLEKSKTKIFIKQVARVERARTDGDLRTNPLQQSIPSKKQENSEHKKCNEFQRNRSKTFHDVDVDTDMPDEALDQEESHAISISRLKVIHEGTSVDPPCNLESKKGEDGKSRKAAFLRSVTAPYKNHLSKRDIAAGDKFNVIEGDIRTTRSNTKLAVKTNKASTLRKENSLNDRKRDPDLLESVPESSTEDTSVIHTASFTKKRSTSYDGNQHILPKRDELHRSISWSAIDSEDEECKQRREAASIGNLSSSRNQELGLPVNFPLCAAKNQSRKVSANDPFLQKELSMDTFGYDVREHYGKENSSNDLKGMILSNMQEQVELSQNQSYFENKRYYSHGLETQLSPCIEEDALTEGHCDTNLDNESYYCYTDASKKSNQLGDDTVKNDPHTDDSVFSTIDSEADYHDQIDSYGQNDNSDEKESLWYIPAHASSSHDRALMRRDRSLESKSSTSTSFHLVTMVKSSFSDEALMKSSGSWEHIPSRRQSVYTETDVDTGLIYHLAKRQTTRAHFPPYHDLSIVSRDIYTMSGDVSTSTSSNSSISARSETSQCAYTGGFYKDDPFYDSDGNASRSSSAEESSSHIYFENNVSKREPSELDIYTGSIFNSSQNTQQLAQMKGLREADFSAKTPRDGSVNNNTRSSVGRMQRSVRCRSRVDAMTVRNNDPAWEYLSNSVIACNDSALYNYSNNSNNWYGLDDFESFNQGTIVTKSKEPLYTDYDPGMRPEFHVRTIEKTYPSFDFLKYESSEEPKKPFVPPPQRDASGGDSIWYNGYNGLIQGQKNDTPEKVVRKLEPISEVSVFNWQYYDDYYTSTVRPRVNKTNNCNHQILEEEQPDTNNNHFDDIYTGSFGAKNIQPNVQEQPIINRPPPQENWYGYQQPPPPRPATTTFYDDSYDSFYAGPAAARRSSSAIFDSPRESFPQQGIFVQETSSYSESSPYLTSEPWRKYEHRLPGMHFEEPPRPRQPPVKPPPDEADSYFSYLRSKSPERGFYIPDEETYSFEPKIERETYEAPAVPEIKTVGGIVCRENVANKDDYAEDINRDLEAGAWAPFSFRRDDDVRPLESSGSQDTSRNFDAALAGQSARHQEESSYAHNHVYDNLGARNKWREMATKKENDISRNRESSLNREFQAGDTGKKLNRRAAPARNPPDIIPDRARGSRSAPVSSKATVMESSNSRGSPASANRNRKH